MFEQDPLSRLDDKSIALWLKRSLHRLDLSAIRSKFEDHGGIPYDPLHMLGVLLLGVIVGRTSTREMEDACLYDVRFMFMADFATPDYRSFGRFRVRIADELEGIFIQVVRLAMEDGLVRLGRVAIDSTKIASAGSQAKRWLKAGLAEDIEDGLHPEYSDPEAPVRMTRKGVIRGYTLEAAVDIETGIVVAADVSLNACDRGGVPRMMECIQKTTGALPSVVLADKGYDSNEGYALLNALGITAHIPPQDNPARFWSDAGDGIVRCPLGKPALAKPKPEAKHGELYTIYRVQGCSKCVFKSSCCPKARYRAIAVPAGTSLFPRLWGGYLALTPQGKATVPERSGSIEPVFGDLKWNQGKSRLRLRTLRRAKAEILLHLLAKNLKKMFKRLKDELFRAFWTRYSLLQPLT